MLELKSIKTRNLKKQQILQICKLKDSQWKFGIKEQLKFFKEKIKNKDIHNCIFLKKKIVGYTALKRRKIISNKKNFNYLLFETLIIKKDLRGKKLSYLMMQLNNKVIIKNKLTSFLICKNKLVNFYKKHHWKKINKKKFIVMDYPFKTNGMFFNFLALEKKGLKFDKNLIKIFTRK